MASEETFDTPDATVVVTTRDIDGIVDAARTVTTTPKAGTSAANADELRDKATAALTANATYLALPSPTNAQNLAQIRALTREANALVRLLLGSLDSLDGT